MQSLPVGCQTCRACTLPVIIKQPLRRKKHIPCIGTSQRKGRVTEFPFLDGHKSSYEAIASYSPTAYRLMASPKNMETCCQDGIDGL